MNATFPVQSVARRVLNGLLSLTIITGVSVVALSASGVASAASPRVVHPHAKTTTTTTLSSSANPVTYGSSVTFTARVSHSDNGGTVSLTVNGSALTGCQSLTISFFGRATCTVTSLPVGANAIIATYSGDTGYSGSTSNTLTETVTALATTTVVTSSGSPATYGSTVTYTATVTPAPVGGTVSFTDNTVAVSTCQTVTLTAGKATCQVSTDPVGARSIVAKFSGSTDYATSTSATFTETISIAPTTTTVTSSVYPDAFGNPVTYTATVAPSDNGGTVSFTDGGNALSGCQNVTLTSGKATCLQSSPSVGTHPIVAKYSGDTDFATSTSTTFSEVVDSTSTSTAVTSSAYPIAYGTSVTYTATVTGGDGGGTVSFTDGGSAIASCQGLSLSAGKATCVVASSSVGTHSIVATYSGDTNYPGSTSAPFSELVNPASTSVFVSSSANPVSFGTNVTYTATVEGSDGGGSVSFTDGGNAITGCQTLALVSGQATCTVTSPAIGGHAILAAYSGDTDFGGSVSPTFNESVTGSIPTSTGVIASAYPVTYGTSVTYTATVTGSDGGGTVSFTDGGSPIADCQTETLSAGQATCQVANSSVGTHPIVATYSGDAYYASSFSSTFNEVVNLAPTGTYVASNANPVEFGTLVTYTATVTGSDGGGTVSFTDDGSPIDGCQALPLVSGQATCQLSGDLGTQSIVATYGGDSDYATSTSVIFSETVNQAATSVSVASSENPAPYGDTVTYTATVTGSDGGGTVSFSDNSSPIANCQGLSLSDGVATCQVSATLGDHAIVATYSGDTDYTGATSNSLNQVFTTASTSVALVTSLTPVAYGTSVTYTATVTGGDGGGTVSFSDNSSPIANCQGLSLVDGVATCTLSATQLGDQSIVASFTGDTDYAGSVSNTVVETVTTALTTTSVTTSQSPVNFGTSVTYTATVSGSDNGGTVSFTDGGNPIAGCQSVSVSSGQAQCVVASASVGSHSIVATYSGDTDYAGSTSDTLTQLVTQALTSVAVTVPVNPTAYGISVTYTATVSGSDGGGTVSFLDGSSPISGCQSLGLVAGKVTCTVAVQAVGTHSIVALYSGDTSYAASGSSALDQVVTKSATSVSVSSSADPTTFASSLTYTATVTGSDNGGSVAFTSGGNPITGCSSQPVSGGKATCVVTAALGSFSIVATYSGDTNYLGSESTTLTQTVTTAPTTTVVTSSADPVSFGTSVTYTATVAGSDGSGTVSFTDGGNAIATCQGLTLTSLKALCTVASSSVGTHAIVATYSGDTDYAGSAATTFTETVNPDATSTSLSSSTDPTPYGTSVTYTATVTGSDGGGTVSFTDGGNAISGCQSQSLSSSKAMCVVATSTVGSHSIVATYSGDTDTAGSVSSSLSETIHVAPTTVVVTASTEPSRYGTSVTYTATVAGSDGGGSVSFSEGGSSVSGCQSLGLSNGKATCVIASSVVGLHLIVASYSGDTDYASATSTSFVEAVVKAPTAMRASATPKSTKAGTKVKLSVSNLPTDATGTVQFKSGRILLCSAKISKGSASCTTSAKLAKGSYVVSARYSGDQHYLVTVKITRFTIS